MLKHTIPVAFNDGTGDPCPDKNITRQWRGDTGEKAQGIKDGLEVSTPLSSALKALPVLCEPESNNLTSWVAAFYANNTGAGSGRFPNILDTPRADSLGQAAVFEKNSRIGRCFWKKHPGPVIQDKKLVRTQRLLRLADPAYLAHSMKKRRNSSGRYKGKTVVFRGFQGWKVLTC